MRDANYDYCPSPVGRFRLLLVMLLLFGAGRVGQAAEYYYLNSGSVEWKKILPPPPTPNSAEELSELATLRATRETRTAADVERANSESKLTVAAVRDTFGEWFTEEKLPKLFALAKKVEKDELHFSTASKNFFHRLRPVLTDKTLATPADTPKANSYPSGHSSRGYTLAVVLSELVPDKKEAVLERGREIGWHRVIAGVHYPSDVAAGRVLGQAVAQALLASEKFQTDLAEAKAEFEQVRAAQNANGAAKKLVPAGAN